MALPGEIRRTEPPERGEACVDRPLHRFVYASSSSVYGDAVAILAGDGLQAEAFALLAREPDGDDPDPVGRKVRTPFVEFPHESKT